MKYLLMVSCLTMFYYISLSQNYTKVYKTFKSETFMSKEIRVANNCPFTRLTETELLNRSFFMRDNRETECTIFRSGFEMPGYYQPGEMMSTTTMYSTIGNLKFYCNYYFDANGELQDGDITISKKK